MTIYQCLRGLEGSAPGRAEGGLIDSNWRAIWPIKSKFKRVCGIKSTTESTL